MKKPPLLTPILKWFMLAMVLANIASSMIVMLFPLYLTDLGASVGQVGLVFTITSVAVLGLQILGGWISDSIGRLRAIAIGSVGGIIGFAALLLAPTWQWMLAALVIYQIPFALVGPSFGAFIAENSSEENRGQVYGLTGTIYQVTGIVGPPLGGLLAGLYGFKPMLAVAAIFYILAAGVRIWMAKTSFGGENASRPVQAKPTGRLSLGTFKSSIRTLLSMVLAGGVITWIFVTDGVCDIAFRLSGELQPLYLEKVAGITIQQIGLLGSVNAIATMFIPLFAGKLSDRFGERVPIVSGFLLVFAAFMVFLQAETFWVFALSWSIFGVGSGLLDPAYQSLISKVVPAELLGTFTGVFRGSLGFFSLPAPWLGAQLWERYNPRLPFFITAIASLSILPLVWFKFKAPEKAKANNALAAAD